MQERNPYELLRKKLENAEMQAPGFDDLFGTDVTGDKALRSICSEKLFNKTAPAPSFEELFAEESLGKQIDTTEKRIQAPVRKMLPWWSFAGVAAACLVMIMLLPKTGMPTPENRSQSISKENRPSSVSSITAKRTTGIALNTPKLNTPAPVLLKVEPTAPTGQATLKTTEATVDNQETSTENKEVLEKIQPAATPAMQVKHNRSLEEAYAQARLKKTSRGKDKSSISLAMNSANRLLSSVNEKTDQSLRFFGQSNSSSGYDRLEGTTGNQLRSYTAGVNDWNSPENLDGLPLDKIETKTYMPVNVGLTLSIPLLTDVSLITGIQYTYLQNKITGKASGSAFTRKQELHYLGIPVKLAYNFLHTGRFTFYTIGGGTIEKGLIGVQKCHIDNPVNGMNDWKNTQTISGIQTSLTGQLGMNFELNKRFVLYTEPGVAWFPDSQQPISNRTEEPFNFNLSMGVRYSLR